MSPKKEKLDDSRISVAERPAPNATVRLENADMLSKYRVKNPNIKVGHPKTSTNLTADEISDDDEIWICQLPVTMDVNKLIGKSIKLSSKKTTIRTDDGEIECSSSKFGNSSNVYDNTVSLVLQNNDSSLSIKNIKPKGQLAFHTKINDIDESIELTPTGRHECTIFPNNLITRHPLFGRNFTETIQVNEAIQKRLIEAHEISKKIENSKTRIKQEKDCSDTPLQTPSKKHKKRKHESVEEDFETPKEKIKIENHDDDLVRIKNIFQKNN